MLPNSLCTYMQSLVMIGIPWLHQPYYYSNSSEKTYDSENTCWNSDRYWTLTPKAVFNDFFLNEVILLHTVRFTDTVKCCHTEYLQLSSYPHCLSVSTGIYVDKKCSTPVHPTFQKYNSLVAQRQQMVSNYRLSHNIAVGLQAETQLFWPVTWLDTPISIT